MRRTTTISKTRQIRTLIVTAGSLLSVVLAAIVSPATWALTSLMSGVEAAHSTGTPTSIFGGAGIFTSVTNVLLFVIGVLSVIMIIVGGLRYVISGGNATAVSAAKNTVLYAIVGIVIAFLAYAIVNFVLSTLAPGVAGVGFGGGANWSDQ